MDFWIKNEGFHPAKNFGNRINYEIFDLYHSVVAIVTNKKMPPTQTLRRSVVANIR